MAKLFHRTVYIECTFLQYYYTNATATELYGHLAPWATELRLMEERLLATAVLLPAAITSLSIANLANTSETTNPVQAAPKIGRQLSTEKQ